MTFAFHHKTNGCKWLQQVYIFCCVRQYTYWLNPDLLDHLQPVSWVLYTRYYSTGMDADLCVHNWWHYLCHHHHYTACLFILEISHHALCSVVGFSCKWVCENCSWPLILYFAYTFTAPLSVLLVCVLLSLLHFHQCIDRLRDRKGIQPEKTYSNP